MGKEEQYETDYPVDVTMEKGRELAQAREDIIKKPKAKLKGIRLEDKIYLSLLFDSFQAMCENQYEFSDRKIKETHRYSPVQLWRNTVAYFRVTIDSGQPLTLSGLAMFNGYSRKQLFNFMHTQSLPEEFYFLFEAAKFVEMYNEYAAHKKQNPAGPIFILKNFGWTDKIQVESTSTDAALTPDERSDQQKRIDNFSE